MGNDVPVRSDEAWRRIEGPLAALEPDMARFAAANGLGLSRNRHDWPERSISWGTGVQCLIQVYLDSLETLGLNVWIVASQDRGGRRFWKRDFLRKGVGLDELQPQMAEILTAAKSTLDAWAGDPDCLEPVS